MAVRAMIGGVICGEGEVMEIESDLVYVIKVLADGFGTSAGTRDRCGSQGRQVSYEVDGQSMNAAGAWNNEQAHELNLAPKSATRNLYLPLITR